jgi:hypothetical protein
MNMARIESHPGLFGNPYMDTKSKTHEANPQKGFVVQINASENFGLASKAPTAVTPSRMQKFRSISSATEDRVHNPKSRPY